MAEREFEVDKVYLQGSDGRIHMYEELLSKVEGFVAVIPNPSNSKTKESEEVPQV